MNEITLPDIVSSIAGGAITLAGFAAVFRAFSGKLDPDGHSRVRLNSVIEGGLLIAFICYLPVLLHELFHDSFDVWEMSCLLILIWGILRIAIPSGKVLIMRVALPSLYVPVVLCGLISIIAALLNLFSISPFSPYSTYLLSLVALFANVCLVFIAQFRVEWDG